MNHYNYPDTRVVRTRSAIHEAILALLEVMPYSTISVTDIAKKAGVNRVTFYSHYSSKAELLEELMEEKFSEYFAMVDSIKPLKELDQLMAVLETYFRSSLDHISRNVTFYRMLLSGALPEYKRRFEDRLHASMACILKGTEGRDGATSKVDLDFYIEWTVGGTVHVIRKWLNSGMDASHEQFMEQMLLISAVSSKLFGVRGEML
ncbi:TetR/AcrR family transcriptional regulator [Paenibacillus kobensis]|uniref:TetR/AcrR family transcriptional regulator n=1 Tax=Paenibacillus kobensis TaxID=59841 RepID=UPI000FDA541B|nr:TetR/AcrR family transcriptional regulator [Paenibacillus kobensis]